MLWLLSNRIRNGWLKKEKEFTSPSILRDLLLLADDSCLWMDFNGKQWTHEENSWIFIPSMSRDEECVLFNKNSEDQYCELFLNIIFRHIHIYAVVKIVIFPPKLFGLTFNMWWKLKNIFNLKFQSSFQLRVLLSNNFLTSL